jgi:hypothetical protein
MKAHRHFLWLAAMVVTAIAGAAAAPAPKGPTPPPLSPRFLQVRERIDALLLKRSTPPEAPDPINNPFRVGSALPVAPIVRGVSDGGGVPSVRSSEARGQALAILDQLIPTLKIGGKMGMGTKASVGGQVKLVSINGRLYKKGDVIPAQWQNQPVYLRVREVTDDSVTLALDEATRTVKMPKL